MSRVRVWEGELGAIHRLALGGERLDVFAELGRLARADVDAVVAALLPGLHERLAAPATARTFAAVTAAGETAHPEGVAELAALAGGAGCDPADLLLLNCRGDLGEPAGSGCSDLQWGDGTEAVAGHNEDNDRAMLGRCRLLTLEITGDPVVTTWWCPGFLPGHTFHFTAGCFVGVDAVYVRRPPPLPSRSLLARAASRAPGFGPARALLAAGRSAGGFAYNLANLAGPADPAGPAGPSLTLLEVAGGRAVERPMEPAAPALRCHTNHLRHLDVAEIPRKGSDTEDRAALLDALPTPTTAADAAELVRRGLTGRPRPEGVAQDHERVVTLCTAVVAAPAGEVTLYPYRGEPVATSVAELTRWPATAGIPAR